MHNIRYRSDESAKTKPGWDVKILRGLIAFYGGTLKAVSFQVFFMAKYEDAYGKKDVIREDTDRPLLQKINALRGRELVKTSKNSGGGNGGRRNGANGDGSATEDNGNSDVFPPEDNAIYAEDDALGPAILTSQLWRNWELTRKLIEALYTGMALSFPVAFFVLILSTFNVVIACSALFTVFLIVFNTLGFFNYALGWKLDFLVAVVGVIVIGFSVDYVLHLGHMLGEARVERGIHSRVAKVKFSLDNMGVTVLNGAITTAGSGASMFLCTLQGFRSMGIMIFTVVLTSLVFSLFLFIPAMLLFGPQGDCGQLNQLKISMHLNTYCRSGTRRTKQT